MLHLQNFKACVRVKVLKNHNERGRANLKTRPLNKALASNETKRKDKDLKVKRGRGVLNPRPTKKTMP